MWKYKILRSLLGLIFSRTPLTEQSLPRDDVTGAGFRLFQESPDLHWEISPGSGRVLPVNMKAGIPSSSLCLTQLALGLQSLNPQGQTNPGKRTGSCFIHCFHTDRDSAFIWSYSGSLRCWELTACGLWIFGPGRARHSSR